MNKQSDDDGLDEALAETFPASDPPANTVETGIRVDVPAPAVSVNDNRAARRFELVMGGQVAFLTYERTHDALIFLHTDVPQPVRGRHLGDTLIKAGLDAARREGLRVVVECPFVRAYLRKHPDSV